MKPKSNRARLKTLLARWRARGLSDATIIERFAAAILHDSATCAGWLAAWEAEA